jgi:hypothetical protein
MKSEASSSPGRTVSGIRRRRGWRVRTSSFRHPGSGRQLKCATAGRTIPSVISTIAQACRWHLSARTRGIEYEPARAVVGTVCLRGAGSSPDAERAIGAVDTRVHLLMRCEIESAQLISFSIHRLAGQKCPAPLWLRPRLTSRDRHRRKWLQSCSQSGLIIFKTTAEKTR